MKKTIATALAALALMPFSATAIEKGSSITLAVGSANQEVQTDFQGQGITPFSEDDLTLGVRYTYTFNNNVAFEVGYTSYGEPVDSAVGIVESELTGLNVGIKGGFDVAHGLSLVGRAGLTHWDLNVTDNFWSDDGNDIYLGVGIEYVIERHVTLGLEFNYFEADINANLIQNGDLFVNHAAVTINHSF